jgi:hypothetical protein
MPEPFTLDSGDQENALGERSESPIFVLTTSRSGSTLLRFILDSHPDIACPPETSVAATAAQLARTWDIVDNAGSETTPLTAPGALPPHVADAVREAVDKILGRYLQRKGKRRWCDKSLDSYVHAELITALYPEARFICLYRHCMDVIASGVEVCPWGLHRHGSDPFAAQYPGNSVAATGSYWLSSVGGILAFEEKYPQLCHRIRYEDMVTEPEPTAAALFSFLRVEQVPGITRSCFQTPHEANGPGDEKIWFTDGVTSASMGRGVRVPVPALTPPILEAVNQMLARLGYRQVDHQWNAALGPIDLRADQVNGHGTASGGGSPSGSQIEAAVSAVEARLRSRPEHEDAEITERWPTVAGQTVAMVVHAPGGDHKELRWRFAPADGDGQPASDTEQAAKPGEPVATLAGSPDVWLSLLNGSTNMITELYYGRLRCVNKRDAHRIRSDEMHAIAALLGLTRVPVARM